MMAFSSIFVCFTSDLFLFLELVLNSFPFCQELLPIEFWQIIPAVFAVQLYQSSNPLSTKPVLHLSACLSHSKSDPLRTLVRRVARDSSSILYAAMQAL